MTYKHILFDWGDTLMVDNPEFSGSMYQWPKIELCEGAAEALEALSINYQCHVATNAADSNEEDIWLAFRRCELDQFISRIFCFKSLGFQKPSAEYFAAIQESLACEKKELLMVGDSWEKDMAGALAFGLDGIWVNPESTNDLSIQVRRISSLADLATLLRETA